MLQWVRRGRLTSIDVEDGRGDVVRLLDGEARGCRGSGRIALYRIEGERTGIWKRTEEANGAQGRVQGQRGAHGF